MKKKNQMLWLNHILSVSAGLMSWGMALIRVYRSLVCVVPVLHCPALLEEHSRQAERVTCYIGHGSQTHWCVKITAPLTQLGQLHTSVSTATLTPSDLKHTHAHYTYTHHFSNICVNALSQHVMYHENTVVHEYHLELHNISKSHNITFKKRRQYNMVERVLNNPEINYLHVIL